MGETSPEKPLSIWVGPSEMHTILTDFATSLLSCSFQVCCWKWVYYSLLAYCAHLHIMLPAQHISHPLCCSVTHTPAPQDFKLGRLSGSEKGAVLLDLL